MVYLLKTTPQELAQQNVTEFDVKHPWGKGNQFFINEGAGPPVARGVGSNRGNKGSLITGGRGIFFFYQ